MRGFGVCGGMSLGQGFERGKIVPKKDGPLFVPTVS